MFDPSIIFEDNHLLIVRKPPGWLAQPDGRARPDILAWAQSYLARHKSGRAYVGLVHRLDLAVGGIMALAKTSKAAERLSRQFRDRTAVKIYRALVEGQVEEEEGRLESRLLRDGDRTRSARPGESGRPAVLVWRRRRTGPKITLLEIDLLTGFKHQIRAQLAEWGRPIVGDLKYGAGKSPDSEGIIGLWALALILEHPTRREPLRFETPPAEVGPWALTPMDWRAPDAPQF